MQDDGEEGQDSLRSIALEREESEIPDRRVMHIIAVPG